MTPAPQRRLGWAVCAVVTAAVTARWLFCLVAFPLALERHTLVGSTYFFDNYLPLARGLLAGYGYRVAPTAPLVLDRPPGYQAVMLPVAAAGAHAALAMHLLHGLLGALAAWLTVRLARRAGAAERAALVAGAVVALWPFLIWETKVSVPENLLVALVPGLTLAWAQWWSGGGWGSAALAGALAGWAVLCHGLYQALVPVLAIAMLLAGRDRRPRFTGLATFIAAAAMVLLPWTALTAHAAGRWIGVATGFGHHYAKGLRSFALLAHPAAYFHDLEGELRAEILSVVQREGFAAEDDALIRSDPEINRRLDALALADLRARPVAAAVRAAVRAPLFWVQQQSLLRAGINAILLVPLFALAMRALRRNASALRWVIAAVVLAVNLAAAAVFVEARPMRYALPLVPLLAALAAAGLEGRRTAPAAVPQRGAVAPGAPTG